MYVFCTLPTLVKCTRNEDCALTEACINQKCQRPCDLNNPCAYNAVCVNTNHGSDCQCAEGYNGNGYVECERTRKFFHLSQTTKYYTILLIQ